jgi:hypothetical protein
VTINDNNNKEATPPRTFRFIRIRIKNDSVTRNDATISVRIAGSKKRKDKLITYKIPAINPSKGTFVFSVTKKNRITEVSIPSIIWAIHILLLSIPRKSRNKG